MSRKAYSITAGELAALGAENIPDELKSAKHMIYSSPATLDFNSPGAKGFGVKRAGLVIPESVMLLVAPGCCGRNTALLNSLGYSERFYYLLLDDTDIVTGRYLNKIPKACAEIVADMEKKPSVIVICVTCVDALLGTDMERVCRSCTDTAGVPAIPAYMYALTREKRLPPMALVRKSVYSLLPEQKRHADECALLGYFSALEDGCEIYSLLKKAGIRKVHEIGRCRTFADYEQISRANFNIVLNAEARYAAQDLQEKLGIPFIELTRLYRTDKIRNQYRGLGQAIGAALDDTPYYEETVEKIRQFREKFGQLRFAVGECLNADSFELALALIEYGHIVSEVYGTIGERNFVYLKRIAAVSPETRIYSNLEPSMMNYTRECVLDAVIGSDAVYYHRDVPGISFQEEEQPFGYRAVNLLFDRLEQAITNGKGGARV